MVLGGAAILLLSLWLPWYRLGYGGPALEGSAWRLFSVVDIVLAVAAVVGMAVVGLGRRAAGRATSILLLALAVLAVALVVRGLLDPLDLTALRRNFLVLFGQVHTIRLTPAYGIWVGLAGSILMLLGATLRLARRP